MSDILQDAAQLCVFLIGPVWCIQSIILTLKSGLIVTKLYM